MFGENKKKSIIETETKQSYKEYFHVVQDKKPMEGDCKQRKTISVSSQSENSAI
jgi:hypothetical protein